MKKLFMFVVIILIAIMLIACSNDVIVTKDIYWQAGQVNIKEKVIKTNNGKIISEKETNYTIHNVSISDFLKGNY